MIICFIITTFLLKYFETLREMLDKRFQRTCNVDKNLDYEAMPESERHAAKDTAAGRVESTV